MKKRKDKEDESININPKLIKGYITFADIMGWKGIWKDREITRVVQSLLAIQKMCRDYIDECQLEYIYSLSKNELKKFFKGKTKQVKDIYNQKLDYNSIIYLGEGSEDKIAGEINELSEEIVALHKDILYIIDELEAGVGEKKDEIEASLFQLQDKQNALKKKRRN